ncbi:MAG: hypothetical protein LUI10_07150, partial [Lachnospiraceae bacterium]|nr:hypothetical protein [Lachnospiraceae bacterium]
CQRASLKKLLQLAIAICDRKIDAVSAQIDQCLVNSTVEYDAPFDVNDSLYAIFEGFAPEK